MHSETKTRTPASDYEYSLDRELIAEYPRRNREDARLMVVDRAANSISHAHFRDLVQWLVPGDCLVLNETRVLMARLAGKRVRTGGRWNGLYLDHDPETRTIRLLCKTRGRLEAGEQIMLQDREGVDRLTLTMLARLDDGCWAARADSDLAPLELLERLGRVPLPHYIRHGNMTESDIQDYQTVYARQPGSIAAPTAGLHFTQRMLGQLIDAGIRICRVSLHVGTGTFKPVTADFIEEHVMHAERGELGPAAVEVIARTRDEGRRVIAVGTTSVRLLETAGQLPDLAPWSGVTSLYIRPGYRFRLVDALITNFHLPRTTLLVLVRTFGGDALIRRAYDEAIEARYRFFSYGDAMLIL